MSQRIRIRAGRLEGVRNISNRLRGALMREFTRIYKEKMKNWVLRNVPVKKGRLRGGFIAEMDLAAPGTLAWNLPVAIPYARMIEHRGTGKTGVQHPHKTGIAYIKAHINEWLREALRNVGIID